MKLKDVISTADMERCGERTLPVLSMTMHDGIVLQADRFKKAIASKDLSSYKVVRRNQLVVSFPIDEGVLYIQDLVDAGIVSPAYAIWDIHANMVYPRYLGMFLRSPRSIQYYKSKLRGSTARRRTIPREDFLCMELPEVSIAEQRKICTTLEKIKIVISECEQQINRLAEIVKSRFVEMFGDIARNQNQWGIVAFDDVAEIEGGLTTDFEKYSDCPHIGIDSIEKDTGTLKGYRAVSEDKLSSGKYHFTARHIIYSKIRPNLNKVALPAFEGLCSADAYVILPKKNVERIFLAFVLRSRCFLDYIIPLSGRSGMPKANQVQVRGFQFPLPPLTLQREFAAFVAKVDKLAFAARRRRDVARQLYRAKIQEFFG